MAGIGTERMAQVVPGEVFDLGVVERRLKLMITCPRRYFPPRCFRSRGFLGPILGFVHRSTQRNNDIRMNHMDLLPIALCRTNLHMITLQSVTKSAASFAQPIAQSLGDGSVRYCASTRLLWRIGMCNGWEPPDQRFLDSSPRREVSTFRTPRR